MGEWRWAENAIERALVKNLPGWNQSAKYIRAKSRESCQDIRSFATRPCRSVVGLLQIHEHLP